MRAQLLDAYRPESLVATVDHLTLLQIDPTAAIAPNVDLVAWPGSASATTTPTCVSPWRRSAPWSSTRLRPADGRHRPGAGDRRGPDACERPRVARGQRRLPRRRRGTAGRRGAVDCRGGARTPRRCRGGRRGGPTTGTSTGCWSCSAAPAKWRSVAGAGGSRTWDVAERVYPPDLVPLPYDEARRMLDERRLSSLGIARADLEGPG